MRDFVVSVGFLKVVRFKNGYSLTYSNNIVSNRQLANYLRMNKMNLRIIKPNKKGKYNDKDNVCVPWQHLSFTNGRVYF